MSENQQNTNNQIAGALTFPSRNEGNAQPLPEQPRQPTNLQGLLRFAMEATRAEDAPGDSQLGPMDEERRKFLEQALSSLTVDMTEVVRSAITTLTDQEVMRSIQLGDQVPQEVRTAFDNLLELVDDMDVANDFYKLGGFSIFPICLGSENETIRALASSVLGEVCQNNPYCQSRALECGLLGVLLGLVQTERGEPLIKELYALSCLCRGCEGACAELVSRGGGGALARLLAAEEPAARTKAAFIVLHLCRNYTPAREQFINQNLVKQIGVQIKNGRDSTSEHLLSILLSLLEDRDDAVLAQCADPALGLKDVLERHLKCPELEDDSFREEKEYCQQLLDILDSVPGVECEGEVVDR